MAVAKDEIDLNKKLDILRTEERFYENQIEKINNELSKLQSEEDALKSWLETEKQENDIAMLLEDDGREDQESVMSTEQK
ncbi:DgyrCDS10551 [Dimorphilus gyrociliatus]|uniref:DgyrCDS10551 n=1 Tax=Dimorphilus gyrociliatus TaxID=2664684 RepID=A0A7I8W0M9_9ANNE|nr:DgyrCDS10551 [Dimorphilus gyrociliatus]